MEEHIVQLATMTAANIPLLHKKCVPCEGGVQSFTEAQITEYLAQLKTEWEVVENKKIRRKFRFNDFKETIAFMSKVAELAEQEGHHPDIRIFGYKNVEIELSTHAIGGLSENDFTLAAKIDRLQTRSRQGVNHLPKLSKEPLLWQGSGSCTQALHL